MSAAAKPTVAVFDLDRTITKRGTWTPFLLSAARRRPRKFLALPGILAAWARWRLGLGTRDALKERMLDGVLSGTPRPELEALAEAFVERLARHGLRPGALAAIGRHRGAGDRLVLATACIDLIAERLAERLGFETIVCTRSGWDAQDCMLGRFDGGNCHGEVKLEALRRALPGPREACTLVFYSDAAADLPLLLWADHATVVNPSRRFKALALSKGLRVTNWDGGGP